MASPLERSSGDAFLLFLITLRLDKSHVPYTNTTFLAIDIYRHIMGY